MKAFFKGAFVLRKLTAINRLNAEKSVYFQDRTILVQIVRRVGLTIVAGMRRLRMFTKRKAIADPIQPIFGREPMSQDFQELFFGFGLSGSDPDQSVFEWGDNTEPGGASFHSSDDILAEVARKRSPAQMRALA
ncbi:MAG: hypothetical protein AAGA34_15850, partial [Pseudomonadota bacterium]